MTAEPIESTRSRILEIAEEEMYRHGYQGMRIETVIQRTKVAKGALYHHFPSKLALGYAVVDERLLLGFESLWKELSHQQENPLKALKAIFLKIKIDLDAQLLFNGCPLNNLTQEMCALDKGFQSRLFTVQETIVSALAEAISQGTAKGFIKESTKPYPTALFLHSCYQGIMSVAKCMQSNEHVPFMFDCVNDYLNSLATTK